MGTIYDCARSVMVSLSLAYPIAVAILAVWCLYVAVRGLVAWRQSR